MIEVVAAAFTDEAVRGDAIAAVELIPTAKRPAAVTIRPILNVRLRDIIFPVSSLARISSLGSQCGIREKVSSCNED